MIRHRFSDTSGLLIKAMMSPKFDMYLEIVSSEHRNAYPVSKIAAAAYYAVQEDHWWVPTPKRAFYVDYWKDDQALIDVLTRACDRDYVIDIGHRVTQNRKAVAGMEILARAYEQHRLNEFRKGVTDDPDVRLQPNEAYDYQYNVTPPKKTKN